MNNYNGYYNWYQNYYNPSRVNNSYKENLFPPQEGFDKGNLFSSLYEPYKNFQPQKPMPKNEQEKLLYELQAICFAAHEINLYLDTHPTDQSMITLFNDYRRKVDELTLQYEQKYGPLTVSSNQMQSNNFEWVTTKWPWEGYNV